MLFFTGLLSFVIMCTGDIAKIKTKSRFSVLFFSVGFLLLAAVTVSYAAASLPTGRSIVVMIVFSIFAVIAGFLLFVSLFGSFPAEDGYIKNEAVVYDKGLYALSRHPGVVFFALFYIFMSAAGFCPLYVSLGFSGANLLYALFQDIYIFPKQLSGYDDYKKRVRFLIPNTTGIKNCLSAIKKKS